LKKKKKRRRWNALLERHIGRRRKSWGRKNMREGRRVEGGRM